MGELIHQQRHFLRLFVQTSSTQRKALLDTVTLPQLKVLSEIAHNIIRDKVPPSVAEQEQLKRNRRLIHLLGTQRLGFKHKQRLIRGKQRILYLLVKSVVTYLKL